MLSKTLKVITKATLAVSAAGYIAKDQYDGMRRDEFVVMRDPSSSLSFSASVMKSRIEAAGEIVRSSPSSFVVKTTRERAEELRRPGLVVEPVMKYSVPKPVRANEALFSCDGPAPRPTPEPPPPPNDEETDWGVARVGSPSAFARGITAKGVKVCVLDTGVDRGHEDLAVLGGYNFTSSNTADYQDRQGHGTHTAGLVAAVAGNGRGVVGSSQATILIGKVLDDEGYGYNDWIANGIVWSVGQGCTIISMSLGGPDRSEVLESAIVFAGSKGVRVVAAAGNESSNFVGYPAGYDYPGVVFSVSATGPDDELAWFSNYGKVEMTCPGLDILSTVPGGYDRYSGTSMATPICAGVMALYESVGKEIQYNAIGSPTFFGRGMPNAEGAR